MKLGSFGGEEGIQTPGTVTAPLFEAAPSTNESTSPFGVNAYRPLL